LAQDEIIRCRLFQRIDSGGWRFRSPSKALRTSISCQTRQAFASCGAFVPARGEEPVAVRSATSRVGRRRILSAFARIRRSDRRIRLPDQSLVARDGSKTEVDVATGPAAGPAATCLALNGKKRPTGPWLQPRRTD